METYKHVLLAVDLHPDCDKATVEQGLGIAKEYGAKLTILHAIEHINAYGVAQAYPTILDVEEQLVDEAIEALKKLRQEYEVPDAEVIVETGSPKMVILDKIKELGVDLAVVGSHGRHGINVLLGSTANAILHHAPCDVLAVRVK